MRRARWIVAALACAGCERSAVISIPLSSADMDFAFVALIDRRGELTRTFPLVDLRAPSADALQAPAGDGDAEVVVAGFTEAQLAAEVHGFDASRRGEIAIRRGSSCAGGTIQPGGALALTAFPRGSIVRRGAIPAEGPVDLAPAETPPAISAHAVEVPVDLERCTPEPLVLRPFAGARPLDAHLLDVDLGADLLGVARVSRDRVVVSARRVLYVLDRGRPFAPGSGRAAVVDPGPESDGDRNLVVDVAIDWSRSTRDGDVYGSAAAGTFAKGGAIYDFQVTAAGTITASTATLTASGLTRLAFTSRGELIAVGTDGLVVTRDAPGAPFRSERLVDRRQDPPAPALTQVVTPGLPGVGVVMASKRGSLWTRPSLRGPDLTEVVSPIAIGPILTSVLVSVGPLGVDTWVGSETGALFRRSQGGPWAAVPLSAPPSLGRCTLNPDACGRTPPAGWLSQLIPLPGQRLFVLVDMCKGALVYRTDVGCASTVHLEGVEVRQAGLELTRASVRDGWIAVVGTGGQVWDGFVGE